MFIVNGFAFYHTLLTLNRASFKYTSISSMAEIIHKKGDELAPRRYLELVYKCNNFANPDSSRSKCLPFVIEGQQVGLIRPDIWKHLETYSSLFNLETSETSEKIVHLQKFCDVNERSKCVAEVLQQIRDKNVFKTLAGWRDEIYAVKTSFNGPTLMDIERSATCLFGVICYGTHLNGYTYSEDGSLKMWLGRRSPTKQTWPGKLDNMCAGGLSIGLGVMECMKKECQEEASVPNNLLDKIVPAGHVSYMFEDERGVFPECQFVFDLELPASFVPINADGEVSGFQLVSVDQLKSLILSEDFKPNCALVILDFLIRKGLLTPDSEPHYVEIVELLRQPIQQLYGRETAQHNIPTLPRE